MTSRFFLMITSLCLVLASCRQLDVFEKNISVPRYQWSNKYAAKGTFVIADTLAMYNLYLVLRHTDSYKYNNIWLNVGLKAPGDTMYFQKLPLTLGNDAAWEGTGMNDIWEVRKLINGRPKRFLKKGQYQFNIRQIMRDEPLDGIISVGLRVEKE